MSRDAAAAAEQPARWVGKVTKAFLLGGHATFVVRTPLGKWEYVVKRPGRGWRGHSGVWFVWTSGHRYIGMLDRTGSFRTTWASEFDDGSTPVQRLRAVFRQVWRGEPLPPGWSIETTGRCGACNLVLTTQESLDAGFGPVCLRKLKEVPPLAA